MKRIILKLSGEILQGRKRFGIDPEVISQLSREIVTIHSRGIEIGIVPGGGNFFRGRDRGELDKITQDCMGMLGTLMNSIAFQKSIESQNVDTRLMSAIEVKSLAEPFIRRRALRHLEKGRVLVFSCGTGSPCFTTDTAAVLRAIEIKADTILKGTKVDGVYDKDPKVYKATKKYRKISYQKVIEKNLGIMDMTAITLCKESGIPIIVFNIMREGNLERLVKGEPVGTVIGGQ